MIKHKILVMALSLLSLTGFAQTELEIFVKDGSTKRACPLALIVVEKQGKQITAAFTDSTGVVDLRSLAPGKYDVVVNNRGFDKLIVKGVKIETGSMTICKLNLSERKMNLSSAAGLTKAKWTSAITA